VHKEILYVTYTTFIFGKSRGVLPFRHLRHVPLPPDSVATPVNSLQNRVNSITLCVTLNANTAKIVLVTPCIQTEWLFYNAFWCETVTRMLRWVHPGYGGTCPHFYKWLSTGDTESRRTKNKKVTELYWPSRKRLPKRLIVLVKPKKWRARQKFFPPTFKFVPAPLDRPASSSSSSS